MFEKATRMKVRVRTDRGVLSVEDLWDLPLLGKNSLDSVAKQINRQLKDEDIENVSFIPGASAKPSKEAAELQVAFECVKHIISVKFQEQEERRTAKERSDRKAHILELISEKQNKALSEKSEEELRAMIADM